MQVILYKIKQLWDRQRRPDMTRLSSRPSIKHQPTMGRLSPRFIILSLLLLGLPSLALIGVSGSAHGEEPETIDPLADPYGISTLADTTDGLSVTLPDVIESLSIQPSQNGTFSYRDIPIAVNTSDYIDTYSLDMYTYEPNTTNATTQLTGSGSSINTISSDNLPQANFTGSQWGYSTNGGSTYNQITTGNMPIAINKAASSTNTDKVTIGVRVDNTTPSGDYAVTLNFLATAKIKSYEITYGTATGISSVTLDGQSCTTAVASGGCKKSLIYGQSYTLTATVATGYTFSTWTKSSGEGTLSSVTSATAASFTVGTGDATLIPSATINQYTCTKQYRLQNADGTFPDSYTNDTAEQVAYGSTCSYSKSVTDYKNSASGTNNAQASTSGTMNSTDGITLSLDFYRNTFALTVNKDSYISSASASTSAAHDSNYYRWGQSVNITATASTNNKFKNWTQTSGTTSSFGSTTTASTTFTMPKSAATIQANGEANGLNGMTSCDLAQGATTTLTDTRDGQSYKIGKLADGKCWMLENLRLGAVDLQVTQLDGTNTHITNGSTIAAATFNSTWQKTWGSASYTSPEYINQSGSDTYGSYGTLYNYCAASANTYCAYSGSGSGNASSDLCPAGWRLPTGGSSGEFQALYKAYSSNFTNFRNALQLPLSGGFNNSTPNGHGSLGLWWSSTRGDGDNMYLLRIGSSLAYPVLYDTRGSGYSIRCVFGS